MYCSKRSAVFELIIDFGNSLLYVKAKITRANGNNLAAETNTGPVNLFLHSLFSQVDIELNGTLITSSTSTYPYRAMLETLLSYGEDAKTTQLTSALFYKDEAGKMDVIALDDADARNTDGDSLTFLTSNMALVILTLKSPSDMTQNASLLRTSFIFLR